MPLVADYRESSSRRVADVAQIETRKMGGGSITAALFLERFAREVPWAHLDIAGPGAPTRTSTRWSRVARPSERALLYWLETAAPTS